MTATGGLDRQYPDQREVKINFMHSCGPSRRFAFPAVQNVWVIDTSDILSQVEPTTSSGRTYTVSKKKLSSR